MKLSKTDLALLNNFQSINDSIIFQKGKDQKTISNGKGIIAFATLEAEFPLKFAAYRLGQFLSVNNSFKEPELTFGEHSVLIKDSESTSEVEYYYSDLSLVRETPNVNLTTEPLETIQISRDQLSKIKKLSGVLKADYLRFYTKNNTMFVGTKSDSENSNFKFETRKTDNKFDISIKMENLALMDDNYVVKIYNNPIMVLEFVADTIPVKYYIVAEKEQSKVG